MRKNIASRARRQMLITGAGALGSPLLGLPLLGLPLVGLPSTGHAAGASHIALQAGDKLVLSGRLTDANGAAVTSAAIELTGTDLTTVSDADGRFLFLAAAPATVPVELQVTTRSGYVLRRLVHTTADADAPQSSGTPSGTLAIALQCVRRTSVDLSFAA